MRFIITIISIVAILMQPLFFSFMGLLGVNFEGSESSSVFVGYVTSLAGLMLLSYIYSTVKCGILKGEAVLLVLLLLLFVIHVIYVLYDSHQNPILPQYLILFFAIGMPGFLAAATLLKLNIIESAVRYTELFFVIIAIGLVVYSTLPSLAGVNTRSIGGASYQTLSYYAAFTSGVLLSYNLVLPENLRLSWVSSIAFRVLSYGLILGCVVACFIGGGRGAFILLLCYVLIILASLVLNKESLLTPKGLVGISLKLLTFTALIVTFFSLFWDNVFIQSGFERATQFISADGSVDLEGGSSGRDRVYADAIDYIAQRPIFGYGPFAFREHTIHAHNIFLEVWLQFGAIGLVTFLVFLLQVAIRARKNWTYLSFWAFSIFLYPLILTMFSGSYLHSTTFVFGLSFFVIYYKRHLYK